jgi:small conductance mechanosensitive channel
VASNYHGVKPAQQGEIMNRQSVILFTGLIFLLLGLLPSGFCDRALAQTDTQKAGPGQLVRELPAARVGEQANELLKKVNALYKQRAGYTKALKTASQEDRLALKLQLSVLHKRALSAVHQLGEVLLTLEKSKPQPELRKQVEAVFVYAAPRFWFHINHLRKDIDAVRARRPKATADERYIIESKVARLTARLDELFDMCLRHIQQMQQAGMDPKKERAELIRLLYQRTEELSGRIALAQVRISELEVHSKDVPDDAAAAKLLVASVKSLSTNTGSLETTLDLMDELELATETLRGELITVTRDISSGLMDTGAAASLMGRTVKNITGWLMENGPSYLVKLILVIGIIFIFRFATRLVRVGLERAIDASNLNLSQLARRMIVKTVSNLVMVLGVMLALSQLGISLGPLLAGLGVAGFIVGFALQDTLSNFASGLMILLYRPYDVGDLIEVSGGVFGKVDKMSLVSTSILTLDNQMIVIPNNKIWGDVIKNITAQDIRRVDMVFGIAYSDDLSKAETIFNDILKSNNRILDDPEPIVRLHTLGASSVDFIVRPWAKVDDYWDVYWEVTREVKLRCDTEGISIPFPQRDVHVYHENQAAAAPL